MAYTRTGYANFAAFPVTGAANIIYVDLSNGNEYTWVSTAYVAYTGTLAGIRTAYQTSAWFSANGSILLGKGQRVDLEQTGLFKLGDGVTLLSALEFKSSATHKGTAWFTANAAVVIEDKRLIYCSDGANQGKYKIGDGTTALSSLVFYGGISASGLTVGTTTITGGTSGRVMYNNAGVVGEYAVTGTGSVVLSNAPAFTTSIITPQITGVANALTINAATTILDGLYLGAAGTNGSLTYGGTDFKFLSGASFPNIILATPAYNTGRFRLSNTTGKLLIGDLGSITDDTVNSLQIDTSMASPIVNVKATNISTTPTINLTPYSANKSQINFLTTAGVNRGFIDMNISTGEFRFFGNSGGYFPTFGSNGVERMRIDVSGNIVLNTAAVATNATDGFLYIASCAGVPTGVPTAKTGRVPIVIDSTNNKMYIYSGGAWVALN